jgi:hypothetical protein
LPVRERDTGATCESGIRKNVCACRKRRKKIQVLILTVLSTKLIKIIFKNSITKIN